MRSSVLSIRSASKPNMLTCLILVCLGFILYMRFIVWRSLSLLYTNAHLICKLYGYVLALPRLVIYERKASRVIEERHPTALFDKDAYMKHYGGKDPKAHNVKAEMRNIEGKSIYVYSEPTGVQNA